MGNNFRTITIILVILVLLAPDKAQGESWELRTAEGDVEGSVQIEAGQIDEAIQGLFSALNSESGGASALVNLCVAYALKLEYAIAMRYCDQATAHKLAGPTAFNNRGVVRAVTGDQRGAIRDFQRATCMRSCRPARHEDAESVVAVAWRNLGRMKQANSAIDRDIVRFQPRL